MTLTAIPEESLCCGADVGYKSVDSRPQHTDQSTVNIKHTFIELVAKPGKVMRMRSFTDSELTCAMEDSVCHEPSDSSTDAPSDGEEVVEAGYSSEWASPCWGPSSDDFYASVMHDEFLPLPASSMLTNDSLALFPDLAHAYSWSMMPEVAAWGHLCAMQSNLGNHMLFEQWQQFADVGGEISPSSIIASGDAGGKTTVMLRNLPKQFTRSDLMDTLIDEGFEGTYDLLYVPMDFSAECSLGYAFVNFASVSDAGICWETFDGFSDWGMASKEACEVVWSDPHQGLYALVERYRNSPVMHDSMPDEWKPAYLVDGLRVTFPKPTIAIKAPKQKKSRTKGKTEHQ